MWMPSVRYGGMIHGDNVAKWNSMFQRAQDVPEGSGTHWKDLVNTSVSFNRD